MSPPVKQLVVLRRRAGQSLQEFFDYHYQEHGRISHGPTPEVTPLAYYQIHFFDSVYSNSTLAQPAYSGHNDSAELYFKDMAHVQEVFGSDFVRDVVAPDGPNFNDFAAVIPIFTYEEFIVGNSDHQQPDEQTLVASWWVQAKDTSKDHKTLGAELNPLAADVFGRVSKKVIANVTVPDEHHILDYFKGDSSPDFSAVYQVFLSGKDQVPAFLKAKAELEKKAAHLIVKDTTFAVIGIRSVVLDQTPDVKFDKSRQPRLP